MFDDIPAITEMYKQTVLSINAKDYTHGQITVWADGAVNYPRWEKAIKDQFFVLAEIENTPLPLVQAKGLTSSLPSQEGNIHLAGFSSIAKDGYLDFMYVNKNYQRCGVATALLNEIES